MPKIDKVKKTINLPSKPEKVKIKKSKIAQKTKPSKSLTKPRSPIHKENTLAYYNCLIEQIANPGNDQVKITKMCHNCKHNKGKVAAAQEECKGKLIKEVAKGYLAFGQSLGRYLQADIVGQVKQLKK